MSEPKYKLGEAVTFAHPTLVTPARRYEIVRILPEEGLDRRYAVRCADEPYARVVVERDLEAQDRLLEGAGRAGVERG